MCGAVVATRNALEQAGIVIEGGSIRDLLPLGHASLAGGVGSTSGGHPPKVRSACLPLTSAGNPCPAVSAISWSTLLSGKILGIERHGKRNASGTRWAGLVAFWKVATGASPRECTGAPMSGFAANTTRCQIAPWLGSWNTSGASQAVSKIGVKGFVAQIGV